MNCRLCGMESLDYGENLCQQCTFKEIDRHLDNANRNIEIATYILAISIILMMVNLGLKIAKEIFHF